MPSPERGRRVVVTDHVFGDLDIERELLGREGAELVLAPSTDEPALTRLVSGRTDALLVCYAPVPPAVVEAAAAAGCRVIARYGIGVDNVDLETATRLGIPVTNVPDYCLDEVADHALALLLAAVRGVSEGQRLVRSGRWSVPREVHRIRGRRLALLGVGQIGRRMAGRGRVLGYEVVAFDPYADPWPEGVERAATPHAAVEEADVISVHAPLTDETHHLVDAGLIAAVRRRPVLINTSRGGLVDLEAVTEALEHGRLAAVALDVTEPEPLPAEHPLRTHPNAVMTPHMAFYSVEAEQELRRRAAAEVVRALRGEPLDRVVNAVAAHA
jgi:D-3-phosphoglycerate dehydrogenase